MAASVSGRRPLRMAADAAVVRRALAPAWAADAAARVVADLAVAAVVVAATRRRARQNQRDRTGRTRRTRSVQRTIFQFSATGGDHAAGLRPRSRSTCNSAFNAAPYSLNGQTAQKPYWRTTR